MAPTLDERVASEDSGLESVGDNRHDRREASGRTQADRGAAWRMLYGGRQRLSSHYAWLWIRATRAR
jgi:hypothetical protein